MGEAINLYRVFLMIYTRIFPLLGRGVKFLPSSVWAGLKDLLSKNILCKGKTHYIDFTVENLEYPTVTKWSRLTFPAYVILLSYTPHIVWWESTSPLIFCFPTYNDSLITRNWRTFFKVNDQSFQNSPRSQNTRKDWWTVMDRRENKETWKLNGMWYLRKDIVKDTVKKKKHI